MSGTIVLEFIPMSGFQSSDSLSLNGPIVNSVILTRLIAPEELIAFGHRESFKSYTIHHCISRLVIESSHNLATLITSIKSSEWPALPFFR
jgi:hypothetical protein